MAKWIQYREAFTYSNNIRRTSKEISTWPDYAQPLA